MTPVCVPFTHYEIMEGLNMGVFSEMDLDMQYDDNGFAGDAG